MLTEALTALAAAGGTAVVQAAGTDAWAGFRIRVAKWFAQKDSQLEHVALEHLDLSAAALRAAGPDEVDRVRADQRAMWRTRFEGLLEGLEGEEQQRSAAKLGDVLANFADGRTAAVGPDAVAVAGNVDIHAETGGAAAWHMDSVHIGYPTGGPAAPGGASVDPPRPGRSRG